MTDIDGHKEIVVEADNGREVQVEKFPGGDLLIQNTREEPAYFASDEAKALKIALEEMEERE